MLASPHEEWKQKRNKNCQSSLALYKITTHDKKTIIKKAERTAALVVFICRHIVTEIKEISKSVVHTKIYIFWSDAFIFFIICFTLSLLLWFTRSLQTWLAPVSVHVLETASVPKCATNAQQAHGKKAQLDLVDDKRF